MSNAFLSLEQQPDRLIVNVKGQWIFDEVLALEEAVATVLPQAGQAVTFQCAGLDEIDIAGAWVLFDRTEQLSHLEIQSEFSGFKASHFKFLQHIIDAAAIREYEEPVERPERKKILRENVERLGRVTAAHVEDIGAIARSILDGVRHPSLIIVGETIKQIYQTGLNFGGSLNANTLYLLERSMKTMHIRVERINDNAMELAHFLETHARVKQVNYPGLPAHPQHELATKQMIGFGGMLSFEVEGQDGITFQKKLSLIKPSMSLGGLETICSSPAHTSHRHLGPEGRKKEGIAEELIRLSAGIENVEDLKKDMDQALA